MSTCHITRVEGHRGLMGIGSLSTVLVLGMKPIRIIRNHFSQLSYFPCPQNVSQITVFFPITLNWKLVFQGFQWSDFTDQECAVHWANRSLKCAVFITSFPSEVYGPIPTLCPQFPQLPTTVVFRHLSLHNCLTLSRARKLQSVFMSQQDHHCFCSGRRARFGLQRSHKSAQLLLYAWPQCDWCRGLVTCAVTWVLLLRRIPCFIFCSDFCYPSFLKKVDLSFINIEQKSHIFFFHPDP